MGALGKGVGVKMSMQKSVEVDGEVVEEEITFLSLESCISASCRTRTLLDICNDTTLMRYTVFVITENQL